MNHKKILQNLYIRIEEQKSNINNFYQNQQMTITDLYKAKYYAEMMENSLKKINQYQKQQNKENNISAETTILRATQKEMNQKIAQIKKTSNQQEQISGKMLHIKKEIEKILKKFTK